MPNHPWPPNDPERADWDRREAELSETIGHLQANLARAELEARVSLEAARVQWDRAEVAEAERDVLKQQVEALVGDE